MPPKKTIHGSFVRGSASASSSWWTGYGV